jgi:gas vesicle protein
MKNSTTTNLIAFLGGAAIGTAITLLFTTEKGAQARQTIVDTFRKEFDKLNDNILHRREGEASSDI